MRGARGKRKLLAAFLINAAVLAVRARQQARAPKNDEFTMSMVSPLDLDAAFIRSGQPAAHHAERSDSLGSFGRLLPLFGMQWLRAPKSSRARQALRVAFVAWNIAILIPMIMKVVRSYFARWDRTTFLGTYNKCSALCEAAGGSSCPSDIPILFVCESLSTSWNLLDFLDCVSSGRVMLLISSGFGTQMAFLLLPLHSLFACVFQWPRPDNPVLLALHNILQFSPDMHRQCCAAATKVAAALLLSLITLCISVRLPLIVQQSDCDSPAYLSCELVKSGMILPEMILSNVFLILQSLAPIAMAVLFALSACIVRIRMRAFASIFHFVAVSTSILPPNASDSRPSGLDVLTSLHICRCPHSLVLKIRPLLVNVGQDGQKAAADVISPQLQMLWMIQLREVLLLTKFGEKWLLVQALIVASLLIPFALFCTIASLYPILVRSDFMLSEVFL